MKELPKSVFIDTSAIPIYDQRAHPACTSYAVLQMMQFEFFKNTGVAIPFSARFLHIMSAKDDTAIEDGRSIESVLNVFKDYGCCTTDLLPDDTSLALADYCDKTVITPHMLDEAAKYKIGN